MAMKPQSVPDDDLLQLFWSRLMSTFKQGVFCLRSPVLRPINGHAGIVQRLPKMKSSVQAALRSIKCCILRWI